MLVVTRSPTYFYVFALQKQMHTENNNLKGKMPIFIFMKRA